MWWDWSPWVPLHFKVRKSQIRKFLGSIRKFQIRKFLRHASQQISNPQISFDLSANRKSINFLGEPVRKLKICQFSTIEQREWNIFF